MSLVLHVETHIDAPPPIPPCSTRLTAEV
uniref:Uncharacterized protein n=1 Tax=Anguilla anguilla TaxID=7936 RepID=A0A0E9W3R8_ANGAN